MLSSTEAHHVNDGHQPAGRGRRRRQRLHLLAARLRRAGMTDIGIIDPAESHFY
jgi:hypothetical protein